MSRRPADSNVGKTGTVHAPVTLAQIARECDLSVHTVSRVLNGKMKEKWPAKIDQAARVRTVAQQLGYRPNLAARSMQSRRFSNFGYFPAVHPGGNLVTYQNDAAGVCEGAAKNNFHVSLVRLPSGTGQSVAIPKALREACIDGLIVANFINMPTEIMQLLVDSPFPVVYLNADMPQNAVVLDDAYGATLAMEHLLMQGYRKISFWKIGSQADLSHHSALRRETVYRNCMEKAGLEPHILSCTNSNHEKLFQEALAGKNRPEAVFCYEDIIALLAQRAANRAGLRLPEDLGILGYNNDHVGRYSPVPLTTIEVPFFEMGVAAAEMLAGLVNSGEKSVESVVSKPSLVVRESTPRLIPAD